MMESQIQPQFRYSDLREWMREVERLVRSLKITEKDLEESPLEAKNPDKSAA